jgi:hypothetical protein
MVAPQPEQAKCPEVMYSSSGNVFLVFIVSCVLIVVISL